MEQVLRRAGRLREPMCLVTRPKLRVVSLIIKAQEISVGYDFYLFSQPRTGRHYVWITTEISTEK
jgi:hypothetical protein